MRPPQVLPLKDSLLPSRVRNARLSDPRALENRHRRAITTDANAFYRRKGPLEEYLEQARGVTCWFGVPQCPSPSVVG